MSYNVKSKSNFDSEARTFERSDQKGTFKENMINWLRTEFTEITIQVNISLPNVDVISLVGYM